MPEYRFEVPSIAPGGEPLVFELSEGQSAFVLGANGSGKSSLMHRFYNAHRDNCVWLSAHRQTWFTSDSLELSPHRKRQSERDIRARDTQPEARWKDDLAAARANIAVYDLIDAENVRARKIAAAVDRDDLDEAKAQSATDAPIAIINELLELAGLPISVSIHENERILATKDGSEPFSIAELSDGERNALLLSATVLTARPGSLVLIDEPERHLHRSIISPLLTHLFAKRTDCAFIVSTHEVLLPIDHPDSKTLLVRSCSYQDRVATGWAIDLVDEGGAIPEDVKKDIFGARRKVLFIEGTEESLDKPLYGILFPDVTVVPKGNCREVEQATLGVRAAAELHWASAHGLVDADGRGEEVQQGLRANGIYAITCYSVESLYYHVDMLRKIAGRVAELDSSDPMARVECATRAALQSCRDHRDRLCVRVATRKVHEFVLGKTPGPDAVSSGKDVAIDVPVREYLERERSAFDEAVRQEDYQQLLQRYPLRETPALARIATELGFRSRKEYEAAVLKACSDDPEIWTMVFGWLGELPEMLGQGDDRDAEHVASAERPSASR